MNRIAECVSEFKHFEHIWQNDRCIRNDNEIGESAWLKDQVPFQETHSFKRVINIFILCQQIIYWKQSITYIQQQLTDLITLDNWVSFDQRAFKQSLLNECGKWRYKYQQALLKLVTSRVLEAETLIKRSGNILTQSVPLKHLDSLLEIMSVMRDVHDQSGTINEEWFAPLGVDMEFLKANEVELDSELLKRVRF